LLVAAQPFDGLLDRLPRRRCAARQRHDRPAQVERLRERQAVDLAFGDDHALAAGAPQVLAEQDGILEGAGRAERLVAPANLLAADLPVRVAVLRDLDELAVILANEVAVALARLLSDLSRGKRLVGPEGDERLVRVGYGRPRLLLPVRREPLVAGEARSPPVAVEGEGVTGDATGAGEVRLLKPADRRRPSAE
jgi:hypothetical protein